LGIFLDLLTSSAYPNVSRANLAWARRRMAKEHMNEVTRTATNSSRMPYYSSVSMSAWVVCEDAASSMHLENVVLEQRDGRKIVVGI
jgi:hypothetical protein